MDERIKNRMFGFETTPRSNEGSFYYVDRDISLISPEDCFHKYERKLLHRQYTIIMELEKRVLEDAKEIAEKDRKMAQLEKELEESCEELFSKVTRS